MSGTIPIIRLVPIRKIWTNSRGMKRASRRCIQPRRNRLGFREKLDRQFDGREAFSRIGKPEIKFFEIFF